MSALVAGRAVDIRVHVEVMGQKAPCEFVGTGRCENRNGTYSHFCTRCGEPYGYHGHTPHYSRQIAAAWIVVEKLKALGYYPNVFVDDTGDVDAPVQWRCILDPNWRNDESPFFATAPLAICAAALRASPTLGLASPAASPSPLAQTSRGADA